MMRDYVCGLLIIEVTVIVFSKKHARSKEIDNRLALQGTYLIKNILIHKKKIWNTAIVTTRRRNETVG